MRFAHRLLIGAAIACISSVLTCVQESAPDQSRVGSNAHDAASVPGRLSVLSWNVENLFDATDDPHGHDNDRSGWWGEDLYQRKLSRLAQIIQDDFDVIALQEVENRNVLVDLESRLESEYDIIYVEADTRIEVAFLSRLPVKNHRAWPLRPGGRHALQAEVEIGNGSSLHFFNVHFKSRAGGRSATQDKRRQEARALLRIVNPLIDGGGGHVVLLGDFNDETRNVALHTDLNVHADRGRTSGFYDCTFAGVQADRFPGSYVYDSRWQLLDHILVSSALHDETGLEATRCDALTENLIRSGRPWGFGGREVRYTDRGYSDHLPVFVHFDIVD